jgi:hypothetical protein
MTEEERRAAAFREQCARRLQWRATRFAQLAGEPTAAARVRAGLAPLLTASLDAWDCPCPPEPVRPPWTGRVPGDVELPEYLKR